MARRFLGTGVTDDKGVAKLETDPNGNTLTHSYTGVGAGKIDIVAEYDTIQSEPYEVTDCLMLDIATTGKKNNDDWHIQSGTFETPIPVDNNGATLNNIGSADGSYIANLHGTTTSGFDIEFPLPFVVECDIVDSNDLSQCYLQVAPSTGNAYTPSLNQNGGVIGSHHRIVCEEGKITVYIDNNPPVVLTRSFSGLCSIRFYLKGGASLKYRNFKLYSI